MADALEAYARLQIEKAESLLHNLKRNRESGDDDAFSEETVQGLITLDLLAGSVMAGFAKQNLPSNPARYLQGVAKKDALTALRLAREKEQA